MKNVFIKKDMLKKGASIAYTISLMILTMIILSSCVPNNNTVNSKYKLVLPNEQEYENEPLYRPKNKNVVTSSNLTKKNETKEIETVADLSKTISNNLGLYSKKIVNKKYAVKKDKVANTNVGDINSGSKKLSENDTNEVLNLLSDEESDNKIYVRKKKIIALLLPLSGKYSQIGKNLLNSAEMALFEINNPNLILKIYDTKASSKGAIQAFESAIQNESSIVLGPIFSNSTKAIIPLAKKAKIPVISYSNDISLAGKGIYIWGFNPLEQIKRVIKYAKSQNIKYFASLAPENTYGILTTKVLSDYLYKNNLQPANMQWYLKADESLSKSLKILSNQTSDKEPLSVGLLIPEGGKTLSSISKRLFNGNLKNSQFRLLGSGEWDSAKTINDKNLSGSWFATSPSKKRRIFRQKFIKNFSYTPIKIASIAYDSILLSNEVLFANNKYSIYERLNNIESFNGSNGIFKFNPDGTTKRSLSVIEITKKGFATIDPSENSFDK